MLAYASTAHAGNPWDELMGTGKPKMFNDPEGRFSIGLPIGWKAVNQGEITTFSKSNSDLGATAVVNVEMRPVPPKVRLSHFVHRVTQETVAAAPNYQVLSKDKTTVSGAPAQRVHFRYQERGNAQLANEAVQVIFITGERAWVITFLTALGARSIFWEDFGQMVKYFTARGATEPVVRKRKRRRKLKAGEMVNPDMIKY